MKLPSLIALYQLLRVRGLLLYNRAIYVSARKMQSFGVFFVSRTCTMFTLRSSSLSCALTRVLGWRWGVRTRDHSGSFWLPVIVLDANGLHMLSLLTSWQTASPPSTDYCPSGAVHVPQENTEERQGFLLTNPRLLKAVLFSRLAS